MTDPRYAPPASVVQDAVAARRGAPPPRVVIGQQLLWSRLPLEVLVYGVSMATDPRRRTLSFAVLGSILLALELMVTIGVYRGRNWARLVFAGFVVLAVFSASSGVRSDGITESALNTALFAIDFAALYLLFGGNAGVWFRMG